MAILSNSKSYRDIHRFMTIHLESLNSDFSLSWKRAPAYTTIRNMIKGVSSEELEKTFRSYTKSIEELTESDFIGVAVDGKVLRGSYDHFEDKRAIQILSFFNTNSSLILAHEKIDLKTNEIPVAQQLIPNLDLGDVVYTLDALHCQKETFKVAHKKKY